MLKHSIEVSFPMFVSIALALFGAVFFADQANAQSTAIITSHADNSRTGWNSRETTLTATSFPKNLGPLSTVALDGRRFSGDQKPKSRRSTQTRAPFDCAGTSLNDVGVLKATAIIRRITENPQTILANRWLRLCRHMPVCLRVFSMPRGFCTVPHVGQKRQARLQPGSTPAIGQ